MDGLIIKHKWLDLILKGQKTIEVRGSDTKKQGETIYLLESGTSKVVGTCKIAATYPISCSDCQKKEKIIVLIFHIMTLREDILILMRGYLKMYSLWIKRCITNILKEQLYG